MLNKNRKTTWYGKLETATSSTEVIYDPTLPEAPKDRVYLYNVERGQVIPYVWEIVKDLLNEAEGEERTGIKSRAGKRWKTARKTFMQGRIMLSRQPISKVETKVAKPSDDEEIIDLGIRFDDDEVDGVVDDVDEVDEEESCEEDS